jgi:hypothetical protein
MDYPDDETAMAYTGDTNSASGSFIGSNQSEFGISEAPLNGTWSSPGALDQTIYYLNQVGIPLVVLFGTVGNTLSFVVLVRTHLRYQSSSVYLAFLNLVDTGFLLSLFVTWFSWLDIRLFHRQVWCQLVIYFTFVFAFLSVWTVVAFTVERFIVVFRPLKRPQWCTRKRAKIVLISLTTFALIFYSFPLWCAEVRYDSGISTCVFKQKYYIFLMIMTFLDSVITLIIPSLVILILNGGITYKICYFFGGQFHLANDRANSGEPCSSSSSSSDPRDPNLPLRWPRNIPRNGTAANQSDNNSPGPRDVKSTNQQFLVMDTIRPVAGDVQDDRTRGLSRTLSRTTRLSDRSFMEQYGQQHRRMCQLRTTRTLLIVSTVFLMLNLPSHAFRIYHIVAGLVSQGRPATDHHTYLWQQLLQLVYYINFAINFVLYVACSRSFRGAYQRLHHRLVTSIRSGSRNARRRIRAWCCASQLSHFRSDSRDVTVK